jgi:LytS/YehU family sensor histidine kinase
MFLESKEGKITLTKEIEHITNYIELQKLRLSENNKVFFSYPDTTLTNNLSIEPLILLTFVENAFKYGISSEYEFTIKVFIDVYETNLKLYVENNINHLKRAEEESNGIGLKNTKRRLDLIYAGKHKLDIVENDTAYIVNLQIELK